MDAIVQGTSSENEISYSISAPELSAGHKKGFCRQRLRANVEILFIFDQ
jgi:hypothetical protein